MPKKVLIYLIILLLIVFSIGTILYCKLNSKCKCEIDCGCGNSCMCGVDCDNKCMKTKLTSTSSLSNKKIAFGLKREKDNKQPVIDAQAVRILDKYKDIYIGNPNEKTVYLTFDQGYEAGYTSKILDTLKENNVKAAFFITGYYLNKETDLVKRMLEEGHIIGNHTVNHPSMPSIDEEKNKEEIQKLHTAVFEKTGYEMKYLRPPKGEFSEKTIAITKSLGYTTVMWSLAYDDWDENKQKGDEYAKDKILSNIHPGAVILLHATSRNNADVLDYCIKEIKNMGYEIKSLEEFK